MTQIFYAGTTDSPFILLDLSILMEDNEMLIFDVGELTALKIPYYFIRCFSHIDQIRKSNIIMCWFADINMIPFVIMAKLFNKPLITFCGDYELNNHPELNYGNQRSFIRRTITNWILRNSNAVVVPSPPFKNIVKEIEPKTRQIFMIPWCIEIDNENIIKENMVSTSIFSKTTFVRKGIPTFEAATKNLQIKSKIMIRVPREEYLETLKKSKVYCQLTKPECESFSVSLLEAMSYGCVPVITNCKAMEWVCGETGVVVPYGNVEATRAAIVKAMNMNGNKAKERASLFTREKRKSALLNLIGTF